MVEPRKPTPMTPERAKTLSCRWLIAGITFLVVGSALGMVGFDEVMPLPFLIAVVCFTVQQGYGGWRDGYLARESEERAEAGDRR